LVTCGIRPPAGNRGYSMSASVSPLDALVPSDVAGATSDAPRAPWDAEADWGDLRVVQIEAGADFWHLLDALVDDRSGFWHNRRILADAFRLGQLYGLRVDETDAMVTRKARKDAAFCPGSYFLLPCFCVKVDAAVEIIWTHSRVRRRGCARTLVWDLEILEALHPLPESEEFWRSCGISTGTLEC